jgi:hypothetical protein
MSLLFVKAADKYILSAALFFINGSNFMVLSKALNYAHNLTPIFLKYRGL